MGHKYGDLSCKHATCSIFKTTLSSRVYRGIAIYFQLSESGEIDTPGAEYRLFIIPRHSLCATPIRHDYRHLYSGINRATTAKAAAAAFAKMPLVEGASRASATRSLGWLFRKIGINENRRGTGLPPRLDVRQ